MTSGWGRETDSERVCRLCSLALGISFRRLKWLASKDSSASFSLGRSALNMHGTSLRDAEMREALENRGKAGDDKKENQPSLRRVPNKSDESITEDDRPTLNVEKLTPIR